ncbi:transposase [Candidatus Nomurabacteria bacterium]|nr:transposase [Candidatus Nomurabacteria bacterium]
MSERKVALVEGEYYHIYNRGNSRQAIFLTEDNYTRFSALLYISNGTTSFDFREIDKDRVFEFDRGQQQVAIGAYCLMPNHFHILLTPLVDGGATTFMKKLSTGYSMYFNKKNFRTGSLFEGNYKSEHVDDDMYLKYLFSYIHLNPVKLIQSDWREKGIHNKEEVLNYLRSFRYSSYVDNNYVRPEAKIINRERFPEYFTSKESYDSEMEEWLSYGADEEIPKRD